MDNDVALKLLKELRLKHKQDRYRYKQAMLSENQKTEHSEYRYEAYRISMSTEDDYVKAIHLAIKQLSLSK